MAKLKELVSATARTLGDPEPSVNVLAMHLRKNGLISKYGRGLNAAEMTAKDAAALFISSLSGGHAVEAAETTAKVMSLTSVDTIYFEKIDEERKTTRTYREAFDVFSEREIIADIPYQHNFAQAVTSIFDFFITRRGEFDFKDEGLWIDVTRTPSATGPSGYRCEIRASLLIGSNLDRRRLFRMGYGFASLMSKAHGPYRTYKTVTISVSGEAILSISNCLRQATTEEKSRDPGRGAAPGGLSQSLKMVVERVVWGRVSHRPYEGSPA